MNKKTISLSRRLSQRILIVFLLTTTVLAILIISLTTIFLRKITTGFFLSELQVANESIEKKLYGVEMVTANIVNGLAYHLDSPEKIYTAFEGKLDPDDKLIVGFGTAFEPFYFPNEGKWFEPYIYRQGDQIKQRQIGSEKHDYFNKEWYQKGLHAKKGYWSNPYFDDAATEMTMCSYFMPIIDKSGRKVGVLGADFTLDLLYERIKIVDAKINENNPLIPMNASKEDKGIWAYSIIIDSLGTYIFHPDKKRILTDNFFDDIQMSSKDLQEEIIRGLASGEKGHQKIMINGIRSYIFYARVKNTNWSNLIIVPREGMLIPTIIIGLILLSIIVIGLLVAYGICRITIRRSTRPLHLLAKSADEVAKGNFQTLLPELKHNDEIRQLRDSFGNMQQSLTQYIDQLKSTTAQKAAMDNELGIARNIQLAMIPTEFPELDNIDIYGSMTPAKAVGGDLYDFIVHDDQIIFCIGDVSGKGVPAALLMMVTKSLFRAYASNESMPDRIVSQMNNALNDNNETCMFVTLFVGVLDLTTGLLRYCNAGHEAPLIIGTEAHPLPVNRIFPVGVLPDTPYQIQTVVLEPGSTIFLFTDGLNEAMDADDKMFGKERVHDEINRLIEAGPFYPKTLIERMTQAIHDFVGDTVQSDDLTLLAIKRK
jgi:sigma-B regulation protein RsbU (phosphoserine phosphatase)